MAFLGDLLSGRSTYDMSTTKCGNTVAAYIDVVLKVTDIVGGPEDPEGRAEDLLFLAEMSIAAWECSCKSCQQLRNTCRICRCSY